jgi:hypothetical protein
MPKRKTPIIPPDTYFLTIDQLRAALACTPKAWKEIQHNIKPFAVRFCDCEWHTDCDPWPMCEDYPGCARWRIDWLTGLRPALCPDPHLGKDFLDRFRARARIDAEAARRDSHKCCSDSRSFKAKTKVGEATPADSGINTQGELLERNK